MSYLAELMKTTNENNIKITYGHVMSYFHKFSQTVSQNSLCQYISSNKPIQTDPKFLSALIIPISDLE